MPAPQADTPEADESTTVRLHITPLKPELLRVYLAPSVLPLVRNVSYHAVETFPERGFGYVELPEQEALKLRKKLNGTTLKGSKVRIEMAKPEKRKAREEADAKDKPAKRSKKDKKERKEKSEKRQRSPGVFDGVELPEDRKVKRGWTEPASAKTKTKDQKDRKSKDDKHHPKPSKYTKEPELLFKAKLEPVAATEHSRKEKKKDKKDKKESKTKTKEVIVHEFEKNTKTPSFLKAAKVSMKPPVDYVDGVGWVDEDGAVVEPETKKAAHSRVLQLVDGQPLKEPPPTDSQGRPIVKRDAPKPAQKQKRKKATPPPEPSSESELDDDSSVVSSSSEDSASDSSSDNDDDESERPAASPTPSPMQTKSIPVSSQPTPAPPNPSTVTESKEVHPLEALFKRAPPPTLSTPTKPPPINTSFSFFENETTSPPVGEPVGEPIDMPTTPFTQHDLEWRGLRSAAPTPDTAAIGKRFSFDWRKGSQEANDDDDDDELSDGGMEASNQLSLNTRANQGGQLAGVQEVDEHDAEGDGAKGGKEDSEFRKWFWENRGDINRAWKKRRREALKAKRHADNRKMPGGRRAA
ncbi:uncharacterized protein M421DRAFT_53348 [Didymella exigua CBS 183.55]|uniref:RRM domain-containing protein n=1 Tax=Didymella exigua CBS 183.55 TaxID=1150837 RepID=A0A6A5S129_9PLEO|nr:uncharacterized protein M421DRAFT_53348 [Didymella exigua CBS 183.55]KAF1932988.1 hypothetical protein M421DRAFT_53348 [Didymella exigua CBS 183.55]